MKCDNINISSRILHSMMGDVGHEEVCLREKTGLSMEAHFLQ